MPERHREQRAGAPPGRVRAFEAADIAGVGRLHRRVFATAPAWSPALEDAYRTYFTRVFLEHPCRDDRLPSLVYECAGGEIAGFLGSVPRPLEWRGRPIMGAVSTQFIVAPEVRTSRAALALVRDFLGGAQDFAIADDANGSARKLWCCFGGAAPLLDSLWWVRILRPAQLALQRSPVRPALRAVLGPLCRSVDGAAAAMRVLPSRGACPELAAEPLDARLLLECLDSGASRGALRPHYDLRSLEWQLETIGTRDEHGPLRGVALRDREGHVAGWYLYHVNSGGIGEVLLIGARGEDRGRTLDHLFEHAHRRGVVALRGRPSAGLLDALRERSCFFLHSGQWTVAHARRPEMLDELHRGEGLLTRLDGEWSARFPAQPAAVRPTGLERLRHGTVAMAGERRRPRRGTERARA